jgi:hypothetical protein
MVAALLLVGAAGTAPASPRARTEFATDQIEMSDVSPLVVGSPFAAAGVDGTFRLLSMEGSVCLSRPGEPYLPARLLRFVIPPDMRVEDVIVSDVVEIGLPGEHRVMPGQQEVRLGEVQWWTEPDPSIYESDAPYPASRVRYMGDGYLGGYRVATVAVHPLQYAPSSGRLVLAADVSFELRLSPSADESRPRGRMTVHSDDVYRRIVSSLVENPEDVWECRPAAKVVEGAGAGGFLPRYTPSLEGSAVEYVIITTDEFETCFRPLADWKTKKGVPTVIRTVSWIEANYPGGSDTAERIRFFIQDAYTSWGTTYVLLGGDSGAVPVRSVQTLYAGGASIPTDLYYSSLEGDWNADGDGIYGEEQTYVAAGDVADLYPDVFVGRAPVANVVQAETFVDKCAAYTHAPDPSFAARNLLVGEVLFPYDWEGGEYDLDGASDIIEPVLDLFPPQVHLARLYANTAEFPDANELSAAAVIDSLNHGYNIAFHVGHGSKEVLRAGTGDYIDMSEVSGLNGGTSRSGFLWLLNCSSSAIEYDCIAERLLNNPDGGGVATFGATEGLFPATAGDYLAEWTDVLYTDGVRKVGETCALAKAAFASPELTAIGGIHRWTQMTLMLLGDPEMALWAERPSSIDVAVPAQVEAGQVTLPMLVSDGAPLGGALICVMKEGDVYERDYSDADGLANMGFVADTPGTLHVTVTAPGRLPNESTVEVLPTAGVHIYPSSLAILDDGTGGSVGNGNLRMEAGETVVMSLTLLNGGGSRSGKLTAALVTADPYVALNDSIESVGSLVAGAEAVLPTAFRFTVAEACPDERDLHFFVRVTDPKKNVWQSEHALRAHSPSLDCLFMGIDDSAGDGDGIAEAGEPVSLSFHLANEGTGDADQVVGEIAYPDGAITISDSLNQWGDMPAGSTSQGDGTFGIQLNWNPADRIELTLADARGHIWTSYHDLERPSAPGGLSGLVNSTTIELTWDPVSDEDLRGYSLHRSEDPSGPYARTTERIIETASYCADSGLAENTRYYYYVTAVDSSGNESAPSGTLSICTNPPSQSGWPLATGGGMYSSPAVADLDGDGSLEVLFTSEHVYAWHADGTELIDGDGDPRTIGIFEIDGFGGYRSSPAVGELDGDAGLEIVVPAWGAVVRGMETVNEMFAWNAEDGSIVPGWPVTTPKFCWASPVIVDLDGDGLSEVAVACSNGKLYCWKPDGTEFIDGDGDPETQGVFAELGMQWTYGSTAAGDLDGDLVPDLIQPSTNDSVYAFRADGSRLPGWPVGVGGLAMCSPAVGDVDGDGSVEVVAGSHASSFWLFNADGTIRDGWPLTIETGSDFPPSPVLADVLGDEALEIVLAGESGSVLIADAAGNVLPGWPVVLPDDSWSSPAVADIDEDPDMEIVLGCDDGRVYAFDADGQELNGWPILTGAPVICSPAVADLDGDGDNEVIVGGMDAAAYVWDTPGDYGGGTGVEWGMFLHDSARTQFYGFDTETGIADGHAEAGEAQVARLAQNFPNPFNPVTTISFEIPAGDTDLANVELTVHSVAGNVVRRLVRGRLARGPHTVAWDGRDDAGRAVASGVYFYRLVHGEAAVTRKMTLLK